MTHRYNVETSFSIVKELAKIAGLSPFKRDDMSEFFSSPHCCPFTRVQGHHGDQPVVAGSLCDFHRSLRERAMMSGVKWGSSEKQLAGTESSNASLVGHTEQGQWSYVVLSSSDLPAQVCDTQHVKFLKINVQGGTLLRHFLKFPQVVCFVYFVVAVSHFLDSGFGWLLGGVCQDGSCHHH